MDSLSVVNMEKRGYYIWHTHREAFREPTQWYIHLYLYYIHQIQHISLHVCCLYVLSIDIYRSWPQRNESKINWIEIHPIERNHIHPLGKSFRTVTVSNNFLEEIWRGFRGDSEVPNPSKGWCDSYLCTTFLVWNIKPSRSVGCIAPELVCPVGGILYCVLNCSLLWKVIKERTGMEGDYLIYEVIFHSYNYGR